MNRTMLRSALAAMGVPPVGTKLTTWANRPTNPVVGTRIQLTDYGNRIFYWTGSLWVADSNRPWSQSGVASSVTGTTAETTLASIVIPGGMMGANGSVRVTPIFTATNSANQKTMRIRLAGAAGAIVWSATGSNFTGYHHQITIRNRGAQNQQVTNNFAGYNGLTAVTNNFTSIDTSIDQVLVISGSLALGTESLALEGYTVELLPS